MYKPFSSGFLSTVSRHFCIQSLIFHWNKINQLILSLPSPKCNSISHAFFIENIYSISYCILRSLYYCSTVLFLPNSLNYMFKSEPSTFVLCYAKSLHSCPTLCDSMDCSLQGSSVHGILQARILKWVAISSSKGSSWPRDRTESVISLALVGSFFTTSTTCAFKLESLTFLLINLF